MTRRFSLWSASAVCMRRVAGSRATSACAACAAFLVRGRQRRTMKLGGPVHCAPRISGDCTRVSNTFPSSFVELKYMIGHHSTCPTRGGMLPSTLPLSYSPKHPGLASAHSSELHLLPPPFPTRSPFVGQTPDSNLNSMPSATTRAPLDTARTRAASDWDMAAVRRPSLRISRSVDGANQVMRVDVMEKRFVRQAVSIDGFCRVRGGGVGGE